MKPILVFLALGLLFVGCSPPHSNLRAVNGRLDLTHYDFRGGPPVALGGSWDFFWQSLVEPGDHRPATASVAFPDGQWPSVGWASYRLTLVLGRVDTDLALRLPEMFSAGRVYFNGVPVFAAGTVGTSATTSRPLYSTGVVHLAPVVGENEILVQVSNFHERRGGLGRSLVLGAEQNLEKEYELAVAFDVLLFGLLATMGFYHFVLYALRLRDPSPLWFGLFCLVMALRTLLYGERFIFLLVPDLPFSTFQVLDHLSFYLGIPLFAEFLRIIFHRDISTPVIRVYQALGGVFALFLFFPPAVFNLTVVGYEAISAIALVYLLVIIARALVHRREGAAVTVVGGVLFFLCAANEILHNLGWIDTFNTLSLGLVFVLFSQAVVLARRSSHAFAESERLGSRLLDTNRALSRLVPHEFFQLLGCRDVTELQLGDQVQKTMSVMFSDIRSFTALAESLTSADTFHFLNSYYGKVGCVVRDHGGFIDKYFGDGFMTLFPNRPDDALAAAVDLQKTVTEYNLQRQKKGYRPIEVGTGIHWGPLVLGTIGEKDRMDTTVISDVVNLSSRLEGLTKLYGKGTIVTRSFIEALESPDQHHWRSLGLIRVSGRHEPVEAVHVFDGLPEEDWETFHSGKAAFEQALNLYRKGAFTEAQAAFSELARTYPQDPAHAVYLTRISLLLKAGLTQDWDGVDTILVK